MYSVKASGLADGKGVLLPTSTTEAVAAVHSMLVEGAFGQAGSEVVVEQFLQGEEVSILAFCDGTTAVGMPPAQVLSLYLCFVFVCNVSCVDLCFVNHVNRWTSLLTHV